MSNQKIVFASMLAAILVTVLLVLNPSSITNAQAVPYEGGEYDDRYYYGDQYGHDNYYNDYNRYGYDNNDPKKSSDVNIQKIKCGNSNINIIGLRDVGIKFPDASTTNDLLTNGQESGEVPRTR